MRPFDRPGRSPVIAENGMAATSHPLATASALTILREGGNAVDAAIAAAAVLSVAEPQMTGVGGDCFAIVAEPDGTIHGLNASGRAGASANAAQYREMGYEKVPMTGGIPVTVPGAVKGWEALAGRFGTMGFDRLLADGIALATNGFAVHHRVASDWAGLAAGLQADEGSRLHYLPGGAAPAAFDRVRLPALASTLQAIAKGGADAFYTGEIAEDMARTVQAAGGALTEDDLANASADWVGTISAEYGGHEVHEIPPNGQGIVALIILNVLRVLGAGRLAHDSAERYHLEVEAARLAYALRDVHVADPAHMTVSADMLLSQAFAEKLAAKIDPARRNNDLVLPELPGSDTIYLSVVDRDRRAVSFIYSIYSGFGSMVTTVKSGIVMQNRGACFNLQEGHANELKGGKRPMHTIIPAMATAGGKASVSFGVMGGAYQPMGHAHVFSNMADHGMDPQAALDHPRVFWNDEGSIGVEAPAGEALCAALTARGHDVYMVDPALPWGGGQAIVVDRESGFLIGGSDPRKDGHAAGW